MPQRDMQWMNSDLKAFCLLSQKQKEFLHCIMGCNRREKWLDEYLEMVLYTVYSKSSSMSWGVLGLLGGVYSESWTNL